MFPSTPKPPLIPAAPHHLQPMAGEGNPKTIATTPAVTHPASPLPSGAPIPAADAMLEDEATFVQPMAVIPAMGSSGGPVSAAQRSADHPSRPTRGHDTHRPCSAARSLSPLKMGKPSARAQSPYRRPSTDIPSPWKPLAKQLFKEGAATGSSVPPQDAPTSPMQQKSALVSG